MKRTSAIVTLLLLMNCFVGCASVKTTAINRTDSDVFIGNSNGKPKAHCSARPFNGVPITLRVPTHLDVAIKEKILLQSAKESQLKRLLPQKRHLLVETAIVHTDKVFTVDIKRPGAGTLNYDMEFGHGTNGQYFTSIESEIDDQTIKDITTAIEDVTGSIADSIGAFSSSSSTDSPANIIAATRTVAWKRFDIDASDFEEQVACFVEQHMNSCNSCNTYNARNVHAVAAPIAPATQFLPEPVMIGPQ